MTPPATSKATLRRELREALRQFPAEAAAAASRLILPRLETLPEWREARSILAFAPLRTEPDIWPAVLNALAAGKTVCLPRHDPVADVYHPCRLTDPDRDLAVGSHGVREPAPHCPRLDIKHLDFILVPGVGFAASGGRLGRGKGYYDRMLATAPGIKCGVAFDLQLVTGLPLEPHDVQLSLVLTESRLVRVPTTTAAG